MNEMFTTNQITEQTYYHGFNNTKEKEMKTINTTEKEFIRINSLIKKIRITREEWCGLIDNEKLKKANSYDNYSDVEIIIVALNGLLCDEEWEVHELIEKEDKKNDKTN